MEQESSLRTQQQGYIEYEILLKIYNNINNIDIYK